MLDRKSSLDDGVRKISGEVYKKEGAVPLVSKLELITALTVPVACSMVLRMVCAVSRVQLCFAYAED
jgi:hypothetical protein